MQKLSCFGGCILDICKEGSYSVRFTLCSLVICIFAENPKSKWKSKKRQNRSKIWLYRLLFYVIHFISCRETIFCIKISKIPHSGPDLDDMSNHGLGPVPRNLISWKVGESENCWADINHSNEDYIVNYLGLSHWSDVEKLEIT